MAKDALITATISGADRRFTATTETTDDLPADAIQVMILLDRS